jgi:hypothetical protein
MVDIYSAPFDDSAVLRRLIELFLDTPDASQSPKPDSVLRRLAATLFLVDVRPTYDILRFLDDGLSRIFQHMTRRATRQQVAYRGQVRGRVAWSATYKARFDKDYDPSLYVCSEMHHQYDTPENQLVKYLIEQIIHTSQMVPTVLRSGLCYFPASTARLPLSIAERLAEIETVVSRSGRNVYIRSVSMPERITEQHLTHAMTSTLMEYTNAAHLYKHLTNYVLTADLAEIERYITNIGGRTLPLPRQLGLHSDPWIRCAVALLRSEV